MYKSITNPKTGKKVSIYGVTGKKVLGNYVKYLQKLGGKKNLKKKKRKSIKKKRKNIKKTRKSIKKKFGGAEAEAETCSICFVSKN